MSTTYAVGEKSPDLLGKSQSRWTHDPSLFFGWDEQRSLRNSVQEVVEKKDQIALVMGGAGAGKTTLLFQLVGEAPHNWSIIRVDANPMMHPDQLLNALAAVSGLTPNDPKLIEEIPIGFGAMNSEGLCPVVVVDDADQLPVSSLMLLLRLREQQIEQGYLFSVILLADPSIEKLLDTPQLHAMGTGQFKKVSLPVLSDSQVPKYIRHFLLIEGVERDVDLRPEQISRIVQESGGRPGKINDLVIKVLREPSGYSELSENTFVLENVIRDYRAWVASLAAVIVLLGLVIAWFSSMDRGIGNVGEKPSVNTEKGKDRGIDYLAPEKVVKDDVPAQGPGGGESPVKEDTAATVSPVVKESTIAIQSPVEGLDGGVQMEQAVPLGGLTGGKPAVEKAVPIARPPIEKSTVNATNKTRTPPDTPVAPVLPKKTPLVEKPVPMERIRNETVAVAKVEPKESKADPAPMPSVTPTMTRTPGEHRVLKKDIAVVAQDRQSYTIQIAGVGDEQALQKFAAANSGKVEFFYVENRRQGKPWYLLFAGVYPDRSAAAAALKRLPDNLKSAGPWVRPLAGIQPEK